MGFLTMLVMAGCVTTPPGHTSATGEITGRVVDSKGEGVPNAKVSAIYNRGWPTPIPPVPGAFVVGETVSDANGCFTLSTRKRVDALSAFDLKKVESGQISSVTQSNNLIHVVKMPSHLPPEATSAKAK